MNNWREKQPSWESILDIVSRLVSITRVSFLLYKVIWIHGHIKVIQWSKPSEWSVVTRNRSSFLLHCLILLFLPAIEVMQLMPNIPLTLTFQKSGKSLPNGFQRLRKVKTYDFWYHQLWVSSPFCYIFYAIDQLKILAIPKWIPLVNIFWQLDAEQVAQSVDSDFHHAAHSKNDAKSNEFWSKVSRN